MTIPQADGRTEATLHGPGLQSTPRTTALRGPASGGNRKKRRRNPNTRRRPKNANMARRRTPRPNLRNLTHQMARGRCPQEGSPEGPALQLIHLQAGIIRQPGGDGGPRSETHAPTRGPTPPVSPDLVGGPGLTQDPEAFQGPEVDLCLDPGLSPILNHGRDLDLDQGPGTTLDLDPDPCRHLEKGVYLDLQERENQTSPNKTS